MQRLTQRSRALGVIVDLLNAEAKQTLESSFHANQTNNAVPLHKQAVLKITSPAHHSP